MQSARPWLTHAGVVWTSILLCTALPGMSRHLQYLFAHLRGNHGIGVACSGILHKLFPIPSSCAHHKGDAIACVESHIVCTSTLIYLINDSLYSNAHCI